MADSLIYEVSYYWYGLKLGKTADKVGPEAMLKASLILLISNHPNSNPFKKFGSLKVGTSL
jgi:hypothetical protein